nr:DNA helicase PIF1, ATP-dependent [Tanacetum cinerariifolium]
NNFHNSLPECTTFSHVLCDAECESDSSDDQSPFDKDVLEKIISKPLSEEEIIPMESLRTHDSSLLISSKIDSLLDEFVGELTLLKSIPPGIDKADCDFEEDIRLIEKLLYDNSSPHPPEEFVSANYDAATESFSPSHILINDSDSLMEEIDLFCTPDYPIPPGIEDEDSDSERDILIPKDFPSNNSLSFAEKESIHFNIPSIPGSMKTLAIGFHYLKSSYPLHNLGITAPVRQYNTPAISKVAALITNGFGDRISLRDIIYLMAAYTAFEEQKLSWTRNNQDTLRVDLYHNVCDDVTRVVYVIGFQKMGLPHAHILLWLEEHCKCKTPAEIDDMISAEFPSPTDDPEGYKDVALTLRKR